MREATKGGWVWDTFDFHHLGRDRLRAHFAIKLALAAILALFGANLLALDKPGWSITTVMMLSLPIFVGAVGEKALFRSIGTVCGGLLGVFLVGNFAANAVLFLTAVFGVVCVCVFFNAGQRSPYAFFLTALTLVVVAAGSYQQPGNAWELAVSRVEEILLGVFCSLLATALLWPRFARNDFRSVASNGLQELLTLQGLILEDNPRSIATQPEAVVTAQASRLRQLIQMGGRESLYFRANLELLRDFVATYTALAQTLLEIAALRERTPALRELMGEEREVYWKTWRELIETARQGLPPKDEALQRMDALAARLRGLLDGISDDPSDTPAAERMARSALYLLSLDTVENTRHLLESWENLRSDTASPSQTAPTAPRARIPFSPIGFFGLRNGIRSGLATVAAFLFADWLQPPGGGLIPVIAFIFTCSSRTFLDAKGDTGMFTNFVKVSFLGIPWFFFVFLIAPFLTDYLWANCFLGAVMFVFAWWIYPGLPSLSYRAFAVLNTIVATFALDFQRPVTFFMVADNYFGLILGIAFAAVFQRAFWPILPRQEFRSNLQAALRKLAAVLREGGRLGKLNPLPSPQPKQPSGKEKMENPIPSRDDIMAHLTEARKWSAALPGPVDKSPLAAFSEEEHHRREAALYLLQRLLRVVFRTVEREKNLPSWPEAETLLWPRLRELQDLAAADLESLVHWWNTGKAPMLACRPHLLNTVLWPLADELAALPHSDVIDRAGRHSWMALLIRQQTLIERVAEFSDTSLTLSRSIYLQDEIL